jgi:Mrr N-terminal domain
MPVPDYQSLMLPVLRLAAEGETRVPEIEDKLADEFELTAEERDQLLPSGRQKILHNRIHWTKFYMVRAGLIDTPVGNPFLSYPCTAPLPWGGILGADLKKASNTLCFKGAERKGWDSNPRDGFPLTPLATS